MNPAHGIDGGEPGVGQKSGGDDEKNNFTRDSPADFEEPALHHRQLVALRQKPAGKKQRIGEQASHQRREQIAADAADRQAAIVYTVIGPFPPDPAIAAGLAARPVIGVGDLEGSLHRFGPRIGEEDGIGEGRLHQALGPRLAAVQDVHRREGVQEHPFREEAHHLHGRQPGDALREAGHAAQEADPARPVAGDEQPEQR